MPTLTYVAAHLDNPPGFALALPLTSVKTRAAGSTTTTGIFSGMRSQPAPDQVLTDLGDKFLAALVNARADLGMFQDWQPGWFVSFSNRFTANFLHERVWAVLVERVDELDNVVVVDQEPHRQVFANAYVLRVKRHHPGDRISSYPTQSALRFWSSEITLPGLERVSLALGHMWDADLRRVGDAVVSFRDELDKPVWAVLVQRGAGRATGVSWTSVDPDLPEFDLSQVVDTPADEGGADPS